MKFLTNLTDFIGIRFFDFFIQIIILELNFFFMLKINNFFTHNFTAASQRHFYFTYALTP